MGFTNEGVTSGWEIKQLQKHFNGITWLAVPVDERLSASHAMRWSILLP
jgi:putative AlgH/UPF0301 family transcriptional regulator